MTDESVDCFNCGRSNPEWAQVCRSCGVALRHGEARIVPTGRFPTDRDSLISMGAVVGTILAAVIVGLFLSSLNSTDPTVGEATPTPSPTPIPTPSLSVAPSVSATAVPTPTPVPLPATVAFGTELDGNRVVVSPVDTFTPGMTFAHSITSTQPFGAATIGEEIVRLNEDGTDGEQIVAPAGNQLGVNPEGTDGRLRGGRCGRTSCVTGGLACTRCGSTSGRPSSAVDSSVSPTADALS